MSAIGKERPDAQASVPLGGFEPTVVNCLAHQKRINVKDTGFLVGA